MACKHCHPEGAKKKRMSTASCKAKGRRLQQRVRDDLREVAGARLDPSDVESTIMGVSGVDIVLTKAARDLFGDLAFECKNVEVLNAVGVFQAHVDKYAPKGKTPIMVHSRNYVEPRVTLLWSDFVRLYLAPYIQQTSVKKLAIVPDEMQATAECVKCFDEFGSFACLRPAHHGLPWSTDPKCPVHGISFSPYTGCPKCSSNRK